MICGQIRNNTPASPALAGDVRHQSVLLSFYDHQCVNNGRKKKKRYTGTILWNELPQNLTSLDCTASFKKGLKTWLLGIFCGK
jgi:hypothetical protein